VPRQLDEKLLVGVFHSGKAAAVFGWGEEPIHTVSALRRDALSASVAIQALAANVSAGSSVTFTSATTRAILGSTEMTTGVVAHGC